MKIEPDLQTFWDWRAAMNFILGGSGSGLIVVAAMAAVYGAPAGLSVMIGVVMIATGLACVWCEIGRPGRFLNVLRNPYTSWMSREAWMAVVLLPLGITVFAFGSPALTTILAIPALGFLYCQAGMLSASCGVPSWRRPELRWLIIATGLAEGVALYLILNNVITPLQSGWAVSVVAYALILLGARALCWWRWRSILDRDGPRVSFDAIRRIETGFLVAGHLLPSLMIPAVWMATDLSPPLIVLACIPVLAAGWVLKYLLLLRIAHTQGFALEKTPARGGGLPGPGIRPGWS